MRMRRVKRPNKIFHGLSNVVENLHQWSIVIYLLQSCVVLLGFNEVNTVKSLYNLPHRFGCNKKHSGSAVECLPRDQRAVGLSLTSATGLCP